MTADCAKWREQLLDAALGGSVERALDQHLRDCAGCARELAALRAKREQMDAVLPQIARAGELSPEFRVRVLAQAEATGGARRGRLWWTWGLAGATAVGAAVVAIAFLWHGRTQSPARGGADLAAAQRLAEWRAPSDALLATPGQEILRTTPNLGESYLRVPAKKTEEE